MADATAAAGAASGGGGFDPTGITAGVQAASMIAQTVAGIIDMEKRREAEIALSYLSNQQKNDLNKQLLAAQTQTERLKILSNGIIQYAIANEASAARSKTTLYIIAAGLSVAIMVLAIFLIKTDKDV